MKQQSNKPENKRNWNDKDIK